MRKLALQAIWFAWAYLCMSVAGRSQTYPTAQGAVKDEKGAALHGATVVERDRPTNATYTDSAGHFSLTLKGRSKELVISFVGFEDQTVKAGESILAVRLKAAKSNMNDVVVVGYQSIRRRNLTAAVSSISGKDIQDIPEASFDQMLQGRLPGVSVLNSTGELGVRNSIVIRGATNVDYGNQNGGNTGPLYVIDGVIYDINSITSSYGATNPLSLINPNDIESMEVLKDASASAIYGARAGNGVIIVRTKRAKRGKPQISVSSYAGVTTHPSFRHVMTGNAERRLDLALLNAQLPYSSIALGTIPISLTDSLNPAFNNDVDWQGLLIRSGALVNNQDVGIAGFMGSSSYRFSVNHYNEQGALKGFGLDRLAPHLNFLLNPVKGMSVNTNLLLSSERRSHGTGSNGGGSLFSSWSFPSSLVHLTSTQRDLYSGQANPFDDNRILAINGSVGLTDTLTSGLLFNSLYSATDYIDRWDYFSPAALNGVMSTAYTTNTSNPAWTFENYLTWLKTFKEHHLTVVGGMAAYENKNYYTYGSAAGIAVTGITTLQTVPSGANLNVNSSKTEKTTQSYYGRVTYDYKGKYLATASVRRDASSIYSSSHRWGTFPSVSAGWILSDEPFMAPIKKVANFLKFRASWGITGNDPGNWYGKYQTLFTDASYLGGTTGTFGSGTSPYLSGTPSTYNGTAIVSPFPYGDWVSTYGVAASTSVRWEKFPQTDLGLDLELFDSRINLVADVYQKDAKDKYFWNIPAQPTSGYQYYSGNFVDVRNQGLEIGITTRNLSPKSKFQWNTNFNISFNKNYVTKLPNNNRDFLFGPPWFQQTLTLGEPLFNYKVWQINGAYPTDKDVPTDPITGKKLTFFGTPLGAGDPRYIDKNGDYNIDYNDKVNMGNPNPKITGGFGNTFTYKGISLNVFCSFVLGRKIFNGYLSDALNGSGGAYGRYTAWGSTVSGPASLPDILGQFWTKPGDQTKFPRLVYPNGTGLDPWNIASSYFVENGDFLKVKQVTLAYNLPEKWVKNLHLKFFNVYGMLENLLTWKASKVVPDPELVDPTTGSANVVYPTALKLTFGIRTEF